MASKPISMKKLHDFAFAHIQKDFKKSGDKRENATKQLYILEYLDFVWEHRND